MGKQTPEQKKRVDKMVKEILEGKRSSPLVDVSPSKIKKP